MCYTLNKCNLQHSQRGRHMKKHIPAATLAVGIIALCAVLGGCNGEGQTSSVQTTTTSVTTSIAVKHHNITDFTADHIFGIVNNYRNNKRNNHNLGCHHNKTDRTAENRAASDGRSGNRSAPDRPTTDRPTSDRAVTVVYNHSDSRRGQGLQQRRCTY